MKKMYDVKSKLRSFKVGDYVLVYMPNQSNPWATKYKGPCKIVKKISNVNYLVQISNRKCKLFHINLLKEYVTSETNPVLCLDAL